MLMNTSELKTSTIPEIRTIQGNLLKFVLQIFIFLTISHLKLSFELKINNNYELTASLNKRDTNLTNGQEITQGRSGYQYINK